MTAADFDEYGTGLRPTARLIALNGVAPTPVLHVTYRSTRYADGSLLEGYQATSETEPITTSNVEDWLAVRLGNIDRLAVAVLVIREVLNTDGLIAQCTIERRRGSADGPYCGDPARIEFTGAATAVRLYRRNVAGELSEIAPATDIAPPRLRSPDLFAGERKALQARFGPHVAITGSREPTLFEDMVGLSSIAHIRTTDGREIGCGIGWFGDMPFVLEAAFPRFSTAVTLSDSDAEAVATALRDNDLVRGETRLDATGIAVTGRRRHTDSLYLVRPSAGGVRIEPHTPGRDAAGPDQQRWINFAERYEDLTVLDVWRDGASDAVIALTGDVSGQIWCHRIDADGVETWRTAGDETAIGTLHRERLFPGTLADTDAELGDERGNRARPSLQT